jgi:hypothetical protein
MMGYDLLGGYDLSKVDWSQLTPKEREECQDRHNEYWRIICGPSAKSRSKKFKDWLRGLVRPV